MTNSICRWLIGVVLASAVVGAPFSAVAGGDKQEAQKLLREGNQLYAQAQYERALDRYLAAYQIFKSPLITFNVAKTEQQLGRKPEAAQHFQEFLKTAPADSTQMGAARAALGELEKVVARLQIRTDPPQATVSVDGKPAPDSVVYVAAGLHLALATVGGKTAQTQVGVGPGEVQDLFLSLGTSVGANASRLDIRTEPAGSAVDVDGRQHGTSPWVTDVPVGDHSVRAKLDGYAELTRELTTVGGTTTQLQLTLSPATADAHPPLPDSHPAPPDLTAKPLPGPEAPAPTATPRWVWADIGLGVVAVGALGGGIGFGVAAQDSSNALVGQYHSEATANWLHQAGQSRMMAANVFYGVAGVAALAAGTVLVVGAF